MTDKYLPQNSQIWKDRVWPVGGIRVAAGSCHNGQAAGAAARRCWHLEGNEGCLEEKCQLSRNTINRNLYIHAQKATFRPNTRHYFIQSICLRKPLHKQALSHPPFQKCCKETNNGAQVLYPEVNSISLQGQKTKKFVPKCSVSWKRRGSSVLSWLRWRLLSLKGSRMEPEATGSSSGHSASRFQTLCQSCGRSGGPKTWLETQNVNSSSWFHLEQKKQVHCVFTESETFTFVLRWKYFTVLKFLMFHLLNSPKPSWESEWGRKPAEPEHEFGWSQICTSCKLLQTNTERMLCYHLDTLTRPNIHMYIWDN